MSAAELLTILTPLIVFGVVELVKWLMPKVPGWAIVSLAVPLLSAAVAWITGLVTGANTWLEQFAFGFVAVFVNELIRQLRQAVPTK